MKKLAHGIVWAFAAMSAASAFAAGSLPEGYTEIEYIQGNGSNARIVTDYTPQPNIDKIEAVVEWPANTIAANVNQAVWCARGNGTQADSWTLFDLGTQFRFDYMPNGHAVSLTPDFTISTGTKYTITAEDNTVTYSANGSVLQTQSTPAYSYTAGSVLALFASHHSGINANLGNYGKQKLYSFKVWRSGDLIHYFVPCKDSGGAATMVDICDNPATLTKSGTFTAGSEGHYYDDTLFVVEDVLVVAGNPSQYGSPSPAYGKRSGLSAGDMVAVSCGATPTINDGKAYACTGWELYNINGDVVSIGNETSFTYTHPTPAEYRKLEWQWTELLTILPIPDQFNETFNPCRPELTVSNMVDGTTWTVGGNLSSPYFDVEYTNNHGANTATATVTGKGDYAGLRLVQTFKITATKLEDENISTTDVTARRREVAGKYVYIFTNAASAQVSTVKRDLLLTDYLVVGGGGGGGNTSGGGGGAGGVTNVTGLIGKSLAGNDIFTVSVGAGGAGSSSYNGKGANGKATSLRLGDISVSMAGGGGGGSWFTAAGVAGASGGGGTQSGAGGAGIDGIGYAGATAGSLSRSGGGGGAGHAGYQYTEDQGQGIKRAGNGGEGIVSSITGEAVYYGGGGGGGGSGGGNDNFDPGFGGLGGGGDGEKRIPGHPGADGFGGGGGGGGWANNQQQRGGNGGSGTVILAFKPSDFNIDTIPPQTLVAGGARPEPVVRLAGDSTVLTKDVHYEVTYTDNDALGTALMTVTGIGTYAGKVGYATFLVVERYYAKPSVDVEGDGLSWATAMSAANFFATHGVVDRPCEVWIAAGTVSAQAFSITNNASLVIRGGFAGTETSLDERAEGALTVFDGESTSSILLSIDNATDDDIFLDRIKFCRARSNGFVKTGKGGLKAYDCVFETNGRNVSEVYGRGMNAQSDGYGSLVVSNCVFAGNRSVNSDKQWGGFGLYVKNFSDALVDDSLFLTNGYDLTKTPSSTYVGYLNARGSALLVDSTPITIRNSRFAGNCCPVRKKDDTYWCGGTIALNGACGGSVIDHCVLIGNTEIVSAGDEGSNSGGAIAIRLNASAAKVAVRNCTIAYNLTQSPYSSGGITVYKGSADILNTVLWKNLRYHTTSPGYGRDLHVASSYASATIRNSTVTSLDPGDECVVGATVDEESVFALDPKLVTSTAVFESLLTQNATGPYFKPTTANPTVYEDLAGMDAHLLSPAGYVVNGGAAGPATTDYSPAIDLGDPAADYSNEPAPNGARLNAGAFGNTAEASSTAYGQPEANIEVTFPDGMTRPKVTITMGLESGDAYSAVVQLYCTTGGVLLSSQTWSGVVNGDELELFLPYYLANGDDFRVLVMINAPDASPVECQASETVDGNYPPFYGKGGGPNVIHVRPGADCLRDGTSWTDAFTNIPDAMKAAAADPSKTEMWIAGPIVASTQPASVTLSATSFRIRGGFAGVENDESERVAGAVTTLDGSNSYRAFNFANATPVFFERLLFTHGSKASSGGQIYKSGAGDVTFADCIFKDNLWTGFPLNGLACYFTGSSSATVSITNCLFDSNRVKDLGSNGSGHGRVIYAESLRRLAIDGCTFVSNGCDLAAGVGFNSAGRDRCNGSVICANGAPVTARNCEFRANRGVIRSDTGGIIRLGGASHPSAFTNCLFIGNADTYGESLTDGNNKYPYGGTLLVCYDNAAGVCDLDQCTFAYNISDAKKCCAGIQVVKGRLHAHNTIIYGNKAGPDSEAPGDMLLWNDGTATLDYVRLTGEGTYGETASSVISTNAHTRYTMNNVTFGDPSFATTYDSFTNNIVTASTTNYRYHYFKNTVAGSDALLAFDAHLRSKVGMYNNAGEFVKVRGEMSDAIDGGERHSPYRNEPEPNGHRANLGAYGNTSEASLTQIPCFHVFLR